MNSSQSQIHLSYRDMRKSGIVCAETFFLHFHQQSTASSAFEEKLFGDKFDFSGTQCVELVKAGRPFKRKVKLITNRAKSAVIADCQPSVFCFAPCFLTPPVVGLLMLVSSFGLLTFRKISGLLYRLQCFSNNDQTFGSRQCDAHV